MVEAAIDKGFVSLGFSGHSPMKDENEWTMSVEDTDRYIAEINALKGEYKDKIDMNSDFDFVRNEERFMKAYDRLSVE